MSIMIWQTFVIIRLMSFYHCVYAAEQQIVLLKEKGFRSCPAKYTKDPVYLQHPDDCQKFYICHNGIAQEQRCNAGLHFNLKVQVCDYPERAGCDKAISDKSKSKVVEDATDSEDFYSCPSQNLRHPVYLPHPSDCNKFYVCDHGSPHLKVCKSGLHFNRKLKSCDYADRAGCEKAIEKPKGRIAVDDHDGLMCPAINSQSPVLFPDPVSCNRFYMCDNGTPHLQSCQSGLQFNPKIKVCDYPENVHCGREKRDTIMAGAGIPSPYCPPEDGDVNIFFRDPSDCSVYYMCSHGLAYEFKCPAKLHFNLRKKQCDYEDEARCVS